MARAPWPRRPGDGYTYVISTNGPLVYNTVLYRKLPYDPFTELRPVVLAGGQANICAVRADSGINTLKDLVAAMKKNPAPSTSPPPASAACRSWASNC